MHDLVPQSFEGSAMKLLRSDGADYIGSSLPEQLLKRDRRAIALDTFAPGPRHNLEQLCQLVTPRKRARVNFMESGICIASNDY